MADWNDMHVGKGRDHIKQQLHDYDVPSSSDAAESPIGRKPEDGVEAPFEGDWTELLRRNEKGMIRGELSNAYLVFKHHPDWKGMLAFNEFTQEVDKLRVPPFPTGQKGRWRDADAGHALVWLQQQVGVPINQVPVADKAAMTVADENRYHPIRNFFAELPEWDGVERLPNMMNRVFGVKDTEYSRHVGLSLMVSAVARVMEPGCKVDEMVILEGSQGIGKSTGVRELFGSEWYVELSEAPDNKDFFLTIQGAWAVEIGELQSFSKANITMVKMAITRRDDKFRPPYAQRAISHLRQCIFIGTTNATEYLIDASGGRRFLPVYCNKSDVGYIKAYRMQLWAEALKRYRDGFKWWNVPVAEAEVEQEQRYFEDPWEERIIDYLEGYAASNAYPDWRNGGDRSEMINKVTIMELMSHALKLDVGRQGKPEQRRVGDIMRHLGWEKGPQERVQGTRNKRVRPYLRPQEKDTKEKAA